MAYIKTCLMFLQIVRAASSREMSQQDAASTVENNFPQQKLFIYIVYYMC